MKKLRVPKVVDDVPQLFPRSSDKVISMSQYKEEKRFARLSKLIKASPERQYQEWIDGQQEREDRHS